MPNKESESPTQKSIIWEKYGPFIFWGTIMALPAMNVTAAIFNYKSLKLQYEIERIKEITEQYEMDRVKELKELAQSFA